MKKEMRGWIVICFLLTLPIVVSGQISKILSFDTTSIERKKLNMAGREYEKITLKDTYHSLDIGKPDLPVYYKAFFVPNGQVVTEGII